jgi:hypothetical protein
MKVEGSIEERMEVVYVWERGGLWQEGAHSCCVRVG